MSRLRPLRQHLVRRNLPSKALRVVASAWILCGCGSPDTPHAVGAVSDASCNQCHGDGDYGAPAVDHSDRRHCISCHQVSEYRPVPHTLEMPDCLGCHEQGAGSAPVMTHPDYGAGCRRCHASSE
jgi:hypothetical protein